VEQVSDFDGDGHADILWRNTSGVNAIWEMTGLANNPINTFFTITRRQPATAPFVRLSSPVRPISPEAA
jgi:hypothetical protein